MQRQFTDAEIVEFRGSKNLVDPRRPYAFLVEQEPADRPTVVDVATIFLTNRECPFRCLMCDLWKQTTDRSVGPGRIPEQIDYALDRLPPARHIKLYNSGNFFDHQAIDPADYQAIARRVDSFERVIVENHPKLCGPDCLVFRDAIRGRLEIAMGLETVHPDVLKRLNKRMTVDDFRRTAEELVTCQIDIRAFILLRPPYMSEAAGVEWALRSIEFAWNCGVRWCSVIPVRAGNGVMNALAQRGEFTPPTMFSMERVLEEALLMDRGRVWMDLWDCATFYPCPNCGPEREARLARMNLEQTVLPPIACGCRS